MHRLLALILGLYVVSETSLPELEGLTLQSTPDLAMRMVSLIEAVTSRSFDFLLELEIWKSRAPRLRKYASRTSAQLLYVLSNWFHS
jgi:hypothetical protein